MAYLEINNVSIKGVAACVPAHTEENAGLPVFREGEDRRVIAQTTVERKRTVLPGTTVTDLFAQAFHKLVDALGWEKESIDAIVVVTNSFEYPIPPTACVLQGILDLPESCFAIDLRQGCPGWVDAMSVLSAMVSTGGIHRAVLFAGETTTLMNSPHDKETRPLFGDAGTATALEYSPGAPSMQFELGTRGKEYDAIFTPAGGTKSPLSAESLEFREYGQNIVRRDIDCRMKGLDVFSFGMTVAPGSVNSLCERAGIDKDDIDFFIFHQANGYMNEKIRKKLKLPPEKVPYSMTDFGNTASASIPLTIVARCSEAFTTRRLDSIACAFGVGLAWGSLHFTTDRICCPPLIEI